MSKEGGWSMPGRIATGLAGMRQSLASAELPVVAAALVLAGLALMPGPLGLHHALIASGLAAALIALIVTRPPVETELGTSAASLAAEGELIERRIEDLKDVAWQLRENEGRYRDLLDAQAALISRRDEKGRLTFVNRAFCQAFGVEAADVQGRAFSPPVLALPPTNEGGLSTGRRRYTCKVETRNGLRWLELEEHPVPGAPGEPAEIQTVAHDITEQRAFAAELAAARDQAQAADRAKSRFLAAMSHEIRTPMNGILGMASLIGETPLTLEQQTYMRAIDQSAKTLLTLIDEILDFSKIEAGKLVIAQAPFSLAACAQAAVELIAPAAHEKGLELAWTIDPKLPSRLGGDEARVRQILINLIGNAVKFTDRGGVLVGVECGEASGDRVAVSLVVKDTGIGLDAAVLGRLFAEFGQADADPQKRGGTGLGLAISRRLARAMGGDITVASEPGRGATFTVTLMLKAEPGAVPVLQQLRPVPFAGPVLLAFDRLIERRALAASLRAVGIAVTEAAEGAATEDIEQARLRNAPFELVIVDANGDAAEACELLAAARNAAGDATVRGIALIDALAKSNLAQFRAGGFQSYLVRPVRPQALLVQLGVARAGDTPMGLMELDRSTVGRAEAEASVTGLRILLAEDNAVNALLARSMLEKVGCEVQHVADGEQAVAAVLASIEGRQPRIDLVLMDVHMPRLDGLEAARQLREKAAAQPIALPPMVALTANAFAEDRARCLEAGLDDYLAKPFQRAELIALLERWRRTTTGNRDKSGDAAA